jgi:hemerythrin-like domain-containing protein
MDALAMLREDHRKVRELFRQFEEAESTAMKKAIGDTILVELNIHSVIEEEVFYPAVRRQGNGVEMVRRAEEEHHTVDNLINELMKMDAADKAFEAKFHVLIENVKKHIEEEEAEMLPHAAEVGMARLERLGQQMAERKQALMRETNGRSAGRTRASTTSGTRTRRTSASGTGRKSASGTRRTSASGTRGKLATSGTRARASTARAKSPARTSASRAKTTASRAKTTAKRTVKPAGTRARTTKTRSNTGSRRSGSQSGR